MNDKQWVEFLFKILLAIDPENATELKKVYDEETSSNP